MRQKVKTKKPFYKKWWFWTIIVLLILFAIGSSTKSGENSTSTKTADTSTATNKKSSDEDIKKVFPGKSSKQDGITLKQYNNISLGDSSGSTSDSIKKEFGQPSSTSTTTISGIQADQMLWNKVANAGIGANVTVGFSNNRAISKGISGLKVSRTSKLGLNKFNKIQNGQSEDDVIEALGKPNGYTESNIAGSTSKIMMYTSDISGDIGANFNVTLTNGVVSGKSQTSLK